MMYKKTLLLFVATYLLCSCGLNWKLAENAVKLTLGMSKEQVISLMGKPIASDFDKNVEEWHYCNQLGSYIALFFWEGKLVEKISYNVSDFEKDSQTNCIENLKRGNYRTPDKVIEIKACI